MQTILVVEDEQDLVDLLRFNLKAAGFEVVVATTAADALVAANERTLDLVLLDLMLPDLPGTEVCRKLKAAPRTKAVPVIMVTARGEEVELRDPRVRRRHVAAEDDREHGGEPQHVEIDKLIEAGYAMFRGFTFMHRRRPRGLNA